MCSRTAVCNMSVARLTIRISARIHQIFYGVCNEYIPVSFSAISRNGHGPTRYRVVHGETWDVQEILRRIRMESIRGGTEHARDIASEGTEVSQGSVTYMFSPKVPISLASFFF